jgi:hypothetical protein
MRALSSSDFLDLWERGFGLHPVDQGLLVLGAVLPETSYESLADWSLGRRNKALAELRRTYFGPSLQGWTSCTRCGEKLEFEVDSEAFVREAVNAEGNLSEPIVVKGRSFRLPTSRDLAGAAQETDSHSAALRILEACSLDAVESAAWSEEDLEEVGQRMAMADPLAEILLNLRCPICDFECSPTLDIAAFLWTEIEARARRLVFDVHALASAYGWTEDEILALSDHRRALYLEMVQA